MLYVSHTGKKQPKSFGKFFATAWYEHTKPFNIEYRKICLLNGWANTHFRNYNTMLRWLQSNNAPAKTLEGVMDIAYVHNRYFPNYDSVYDFPNHNFIKSYVEHKYEKCSDEPFDFSELPLAHRRRKPIEHFCDDDF
ncbi:MAG: hypothetical protein ACR2M9_03885 [Cyanophyceae cyanobacterium]